MADRNKIISSIEYCNNHKGCWSDDDECPWIEECRKDDCSLNNAIIEQMRSDKMLIENQARIIESLSRRGNKSE